MSSLRDELFAKVNEVVQLYIKKVSIQFEFDENVLQELWITGGVNGSEKKARPVKPPVEVEDSDDLSVERLLKCNRNELIALCKIHKHKCTGNKGELISRLTGKELTEDELKGVTRGGGKKVSPEEKKAPAKKAPKEPDVIKAVKNGGLKSEIPQPIRSNSFGNMEHAPTKLVFDKKTKKVIGKQADDGEILTLTDEDIENCKKYKFPWVTPENLDEKTSLDDVKIDELEEDEEELDEDDIDEEDLEKILVEKDAEEDEDEEDLEEEIELD